MTLGDLLDELRTGVLHDVSDQVPGADSDQLWTDQRLVRYIAQAQDKFAHLTSCIRDNRTPEVCQVTLVPGQQIYPLHPKVIAVLSARYTNLAGQMDRQDLGRAGHDTFNYRPPDRPYFDAGYLTTVNPGKIIAYSTDEGMSSDDVGSFAAMELKAFPNIGTAWGGTLALRVLRLPLQRLTTDGLDQRLEIPEKYHMDILDWAGYLALRAPDLDIAGGDAATKANMLRKSFMDHCATAKADMQRRMFAPMTWAFGGNGYTYERDDNGGW